MIDQRIIPDFTEPYEGYTNASLRKMVRELRGENRELLIAVEDLLSLIELFGGPIQWDGGERQQVVQARAAIAKAKGLDA